MKTHLFSWGSPRCWRRCRWWRPPRATSRFRRRSRVPITTANALGPLVPLDVQVVVSRYQGDKRISSLPFSLAVNANDRCASSIRMGARVPVGRDAPGAAPNTAVQVTYENVGTNIDCFARTTDDGRFQINLMIEDSSVYQNVEGAIAPTVAGRPVIRQFRSQNTMVLRDGQTRQFTTATDRVNARGSEDRGHAAGGEIEGRLRLRLQAPGYGLRPRTQLSSRSSEAFFSGQSESSIANQAVSRLRPLRTMCWRNTPSKVKPSFNAAARERPFSASHFHSARR